MNDSPPRLGPWSADHPFQELLQQDSPENVRAVLVRMLEETSCDLFVAISGMSHAVVADMQSAVGVLFEKQFEGVGSDPEWYNKQGVLLMQPTTMDRDEADQTPALGHMMASDQKRIVVPNNLAVKPLFKLLDAYGDEYGALYFAEGSLTINR